MMDKKKSFAQKAKDILKPKSMSDFLESDDENTLSNISGNTEIRKTVNSDILEVKEKTDDNTLAKEPGITETRKSGKKFRRHEVQLSIDLSEKIRKYIFEKNISKTAFFTQILDDFFEKNQEN